MNSPGDEILDLKEIALFLWRWWWLVVAFAVGAMLLVFLIDWVQDNRSQLTWLPAEKELYVATSTLHLYEDPLNTPVIDSDRGQFYAAALVRESVLEAAIDSLDLDISAIDLGKRVTSEFVPEDSQIILKVEGESEDHLIAITNAIPHVFEADEEAQQQQRLAVIIQSLQQSQDMLQAEIDRTVDRLGELDDSTTPYRIAEREQLQLFLSQYLQRAALLQGILDQIQFQQALPTDTPLLLIGDLRMLMIMNHITRPRIELISSAVIDSGDETDEEVHLMSFRVLFTAALIGAILGMGVAFLRETFDDSLKSVVQVEHLTSLPVLAAIEYSPKNPSATTFPPDPTLSTEAYRLLLARLGFSARDTPFQTLLVTRSDANGTTSRTAANLAVSLTQMGRRVLLVDMNVRQPEIQTLFGHPNTQGVADLLLQPEKNTLADYVFPTGINNLSLLPAGTAKSNVGEFFGTQRLVELMELLNQQADVVVLDSPPLLSTADTLLLSQMCDTTLLVATLAATQATYLKRASEHLKQGGGHVAGIVVISAHRNALWSGYRS